MGALTTQKIKESYQGLLKTEDNGPLTTAPKLVQDGLGNQLPMTVSTEGVYISGESTFSNGDGSATIQGDVANSQIVYTGIHDFGAATVEGIPDFDTKYSINIAQAGADVNFNLAGDDGTTDTVKFTAGSNVTLTKSGENLTIASSYVDTKYTTNAAQSGSNVNINLVGTDSTTDTLTLVAGTGITLTQSGDNVTVASSGSGGGLVNGTGTASLKNADSLVTLAATASAICAIALGNGAVASGSSSIGIGNGVCSAGPNHVTIGCGARSLFTGGAAMAIGAGAVACSNEGVAIGFSALANGTGALAVGHSALSCASFSIAIGRGASVGVNTSCSIVIGNSASATPTGDGVVAIGTGATVGGQRAVAIGRSAAASLPLGIAIGNFAQTTAECTIIIGAAAINLDGGACAERAIVIGGGNRLSLATGVGSIVLGSSTAAGCTRATAADAIAVGTLAAATASCAIALGAGITASTANYTTTRNLQLTNYASLNFADDTAAAAGGVPLGGLYHNSGAARIRIA